MRVLALDVGDRRIGVAISDPSGIVAQPLTVITRQGTAVDVETLRALVTERDVGAIVVGLPLTLRGERGPQAQKVLAWVEHLRRGMPVPVHLLDERLTTVQGERSLRETGTSSRKRKQVIDQVAAQLLLQHFLETPRQR